MNSNTFLQVEKLFTDQFYKKNHPRYQQELNICCDENDESDMITMGDIIKYHTSFGDLPLRDIYFVLIYTYYSLRMNEQTEDWLTFKFFEKNVIHYQRAKQLYFDITTGDIMIENENLSSKIRRFVMEMNGGKRKTNKRRTNKRRTNKRRTLRKTNKRKTNKRKTNKRKTKYV